MLDEFVKKRPRIINKDGEVIGNFRIKYHKNNAKFYLNDCQIDLVQEFKVIGSVGEGLEIVLRRYEKQSIRWKTDRYIEGIDFRQLQFTRMYESE